MLFWWQWCRCRNNLKSFFVFGFTFCYYAGFIRNINTFPIVNVVFLHFLSFIILNYLFIYLFTAGLINPNNVHILTHFGEFLLYLDIPEYFAFITLRIIDRFNILNLVKILKVGIVSNQRWIKIFYRSQQQFEHLSTFTYQFEWSGKCPPLPLIFLPHEQIEMWQQKSLTRVFI